MNKINEDEILNEYGEEVLNELTDKGYAILPTEPLSEEDKNQRRTPNISFIVKLPNAGRL